LEPSLTDLAAVAQLMEEHRARLLGMVARRIDPSLARRIDPQEILTEAFLEAQRRYPQFKRQSQIAEFPWLYGITRDCLIEAWRRHTRECRDIHRDAPWPEESAMQLAAGLIDTGTTPSQAFARQELRDRIRALLQLLSPQDREILWMRTFDDLSYEDIATVLGITKNAATVRYVRALRRLKELWDQLPGNPGESR
jgi:RNA polymerase sigma-70 factor (ECF subfamily)